MDEDKKPSVEWYFSEWPAIILVDKNGVPVPVKESPQTAFMTTDRRLYWSHLRGNVNV